MEQLRIKGFGFRGELMGKMLYSGLTYSLEEGEAKRVKEVYVNGELIQEDVSYTVGTVDMYTLGSLFLIYVTMNTLNISCRNFT